MIARNVPTSRPAGRAAASRAGPQPARRPLTVCVRAFKSDAAAKPDNASPRAEEKAEEQQQQHREAAAPGHMVVRAAHPAMRLPTLFHGMQREMDAMTRMFGLPSLFDDDPFFSRAPMLAKMELPAMPSMHGAVDVQEDDKAYTIKADTPGIPKDALKLSVLDSTLTISGERREEKSEGGEEGEGGTTAPLRFERSYGSFSRSFSLPPNVDVEGINAEAKDGVLTVTIPKRPEEKPQAKEIAVN